MKVEWCRARRAAGGGGGGGGSSWLNIFDALWWEQERRGRLQEQVGKQQVVRGYGRKCRGNNPGQAAS